MPAWPTLRIGCRGIVELEELGCEAAEHETLVLSEGDVAAFFDS